MDPSTALSTENREVEQLRAFIDETTAEVADARDKFKHQEDLCEAYGGDSTAVGFAAAGLRADKLEARLIAARARQETAYNRYAATVESTNKTVAVIARKASDKEVDVKVKDNKFLKRKLKEPDEWKDHQGKTHKKHLLAFTACKSMSAILWRLLDYHVRAADPDDEKESSKEVRLAELHTHADLIEKMDEMSERDLLEYALNSVNEQSVVVYLTHHYSHEVATVFTGDALFLVDQSIPTQERIDAAVKRVQKMTSSAKVAIAPPGVKVKKEEAKRRQKPARPQQPNLPPGFGAGFATGAKPGATLGGGSGPICYLCGLPGHIAALCPKKGT